MAHTVGHLGKFLRQQSTLKKLHPTLKVIGSVDEGTRIGAGRELDVMCVLSGLKGEFFQIGDNAFNLKLSEEGLSFFQDNQMMRFVKDSVLLDYTSLFIEFLEQAKEGLAYLKCKMIISPRLEFNLDYKQCGKCKILEENNGFNPVQHCLKCLPAVCFTKLGACLIAKWKGDATEEVNVTMDLIPLFKHGNTSLELLQHMIQTLLAEMPPNWCKTLEVF